VVNPSGGSATQNMNTQALALPAQYLAWLAALPLVHLVAFKKNQWQFYTLDELQALTRVDTIPLFVQINPSTKGLIPR
jgi:ABC-type dipeptide/oligopeptide/nickel transport system permease component